MIITELPSNRTIADTVDAVLSGRAYVAHHSVSLWDIALGWIAQLISRLFGVVAAHPAVGFVLRAAIGVAVLLIAARLVYSLFLQRGSTVLGYGNRGVARANDWWTVAQKLAADGDYTAATHALYLALISVAARRGLLSLDDSKTTGDYLREVRRAGGAAAEVTAFADFIRSYETVVYGVGSSDADRYAGLRKIAESMPGTPVGRAA